MRPGGLHVYDGHNHQESFVERSSGPAIARTRAGPAATALEAKGLPVPRLVAGGTPTFPVFADARPAGPGMFAGNVFPARSTATAASFADMAGFTPAALLLTRVISRPTPTRVTLDLGYKAVASDPPAGKRLHAARRARLPGRVAKRGTSRHRDAARRASFQPGDAVLAMPTHVCPTCAMHQQAYVVEGGQVTETWDIVARDRVLTV